MSRKSMIALILLTIVSLIIFTLCYSHKQNKKEDAQAQQSELINNKAQIKTMEKEQSDNTSLINKIESNPNKIATDAEAKVKKFVDRLQKVQKKTDQEKQKVYDQQLKSLTTKTLRQNDNLKDIYIPKKYESFVSTSRGHAVYILIKDKEHKHPNSYYNIKFNNATNKVESINEYQVRN